MKVHSIDAHKRKIILLRWLLLMLIIFWKISIKNKELVYFWKNNSKRMHNKKWLDLGHS